MHRAESIPMSAAGMVKSFTLVRRGKPTQLCASKMKLIRFQEHSRVFDLSKTK